MGSSVGVLVDDDNSLHFYVNDVDQGVAVTDIPATCYGLVDVYGQCEQVTVVSGSSAQSSHQPEYREKANMEEGRKPERTSWFCYFRSILTRSINKQDSATLPENGQEY